VLRKVKGKMKKKWEAGVVDELGMKAEILSISSVTNLNSCPLV
jgi:hypothetical protein